MSFHYNADLIICAETQHHNEAPVYVATVLFSLLL